LCIDDDPAVLKTQELVLTHHGYRVLSATNMAEALEIARKNKIDLALIDHSVCNSQHLCFLEEVRKQQPGIKVAIHTGQPEIEDCLKKGSIIPKPINPRVLVAEIERLCAEESAG